MELKKGPSAAHKRSDSYDHRDGVIGRMKEQFNRFFGEVIVPTRKHPFEFESMHELFDRSCHESFAQRQPAAYCAVYQRHNARKIRDQCNKALYWRNMRSGFMEKLHFALEFLPERARAFILVNAVLIPLSVYALCWNIEVVFYQEKTFWSLKDYMLRSQTNIQCFLNLLLLIYTVLIFLHYLNIDLLQL